MVLHYHRIIRAALRQGEKWEMVSRNVARNANLPQATTTRMTVPPAERVRQLIDAAAAGRNPDFAVFITLAALTGLRRGELCGLRWSDVDWDASAITVRRSIWQLGKDWGTKDPKTHQVRRVVCGPHAMEVLKFRYERATAITDAAEVTLDADAYVFGTDAEGTQPMLPDAATQLFRRLCRSMEGEWPYRLHDLRHYTATELFRQGANPKTVATRLGHADAALTLRVYTHDTEDQAIAAAASLEAGLAG